MASGNGGFFRCQILKCMPSPKAVLHDIHVKGLDPKKVHSVINGDGHLKTPVISKKPKNFLKKKIGIKELPKQQIEDDSNVTIEHTIVQTTVNVVKAEKPAKNTKFTKKVLSEKIDENLTE